MSNMRNRSGLMAALVCGSVLACSDDTERLVASPSTATDANAPDAGNDAAAGYPDGSAGADARTEEGLDAGVADSGDQDASGLGKPTPDHRSMDSGRVGDGLADTGMHDASPLDANMMEAGTADVVLSGLDASVQVDGEVSAGDADLRTDSALLDAAADAASTEAGGHERSSACASCLSMNCSNYLGALPALQNCSDSLCQLIVACAEASRCATSPTSLTNCYCGNVTYDACSEPRYVPNGPCKSLIEQGLEATSKDIVLERYVDRMFVGGKANTLLTCEVDLCSAECLQ